MKNVNRPTDSQETWYEAYESNTVTIVYFPQSLTTWRKNCMVFIPCIFLHSIF